MRTLRQHIDAKHAGVNVRFAEAYGVSKQQVYTWLKNDCIFHSGQVYRPVTKIQKGA